MPTIHVRGTVESVRRQLSRLPAIVSGREPGFETIARGMQLRVGTMALSLIHRNLIDKARGGGGADGEPWKPLAQSTIERRRRPRGVRTVRGAVQDLRRAYRDLADARGKRQNDARKRRLEQAKKKYDRAADVAENVEILRDTGVMFSSFSPGIDGPSGNDKQVFRHEQSAVIVGTNVPYAMYHHSDGPRKLKKDGTPRLPQRRLWPKAENWPQSWRRELGEAARGGAIVAAVFVLTGRYAA